MPLKWRPIQWAVIVFGATCIPNLALAQGDREVLILAGAADSDRLEVLKESMASHLSDFEVEVSLWPLSDEKPIVSDSPSVGKEYMNQTGAAAVIWLQGTKIFVFAGDGDSQNFMSRQLPQDQESWELECDTISTMVRSLLSPWFEKPPLESSPSDKEAETANPKEPVDDALPSVPTDAPFGVRMGVGVGYGFQVMSGENPYLNGIYLDYLMDMGSIFRWGVGAGFMQTTERQGYRMNRVPIRISGGIRIGKDPWRMGFALSYLLDGTFVSGLDNSTLEGNVNRIYHGVGVSVSGTYTVAPWVAFLFQGGLDVYHASNRYLDRDENTVFVYNPVQARFIVGVIFWFYTHSFSR